MASLILSGHELPSEDLADSISYSKFFHELIRSPLAEGCVPLHGSHHRTLQVRWHPNAVRRWGRNPPFHLPCDNVANGSPTKWMKPRQGLVRHNPH